MLKQRILTALVLLLVLVPSLLWLPPLAWAALMAVFAAVAGWEWAGFMQCSSRQRWGMGGLVLLMAMACAMLAPDSLTAAALGDRVSLLTYGLAAIFWLLVAPIWLLRKQPKLPEHPLIGMLAGIVVLLPAWLAMVQLRQWGLGVLFFVLLAVWLADVGAYAAGKTFGKHKLAPSISPGKTWEGALGGALAVLLLGIVVQANGGFPGVSLPLLLIALLALVAVSIAGDLFESLLKRQVGLKDSSQILPGHGGVMDRIDSLTSTLPLSALSFQLYHVLTG